MKDKCPGCSNVVAVPSLDDKIAGLDIVLKACGAASTIEAWAAVCPECSNNVRVDLAKVEKAFTCSKCGCQLRATLAADRPTAKDHSRATDTNASSNTNGNTSSHPGANERPSAAYGQCEPSPQEWLAAAAEEPFVPPFMTRPIHSPPNGGPQPWPMQRPAAWISRAVYWGVFILLFFGGTAVRMFPIVFLSFIWVVPRVGGSLSRFVASFCVDAVSCPRCQEVYECMAIWNCSCGYHDHEEQHLLRFKCPMCANRIGRINCQRCDSTILLW